MSDSVFTKIIKGEIPCYKVYEDDRTLAFLDIHPVQPGMVLVVTKNPSETVWDLPEEDYQALWQTVRKVAGRMKAVFPDKKRIGVQVEGLDIPHVHVKLIPINSGDDFRAKPDFLSEPEQSVLVDLAEKLAL